jgi:hypothetical protein
VPEVGRRCEEPRQHGQSGERGGRDGPAGPEARPGRQHGQQEHEVLLAGQPEREQDDGRHRPAQPGGHRPPGQAGEQQRLRPRLLDLGGGARQQEQQRAGAGGRHRRAERPAPGRQPHRDHRGDRNGDQHPAHVPGQEPAGGEEDGGPRQVGEGVLDAGGADPGLGVDVLPGRQRVARLLQGHPDIDPWRGVQPDQRHGGDQVTGQREAEAEVRSPALREAEGQRRQQGRGGQPPAKGTGVGRQEVGVGVHGDDRDGGQHQRRGGRAPVQPAGAAEGEGQAEEDRKGGVRRDDPEPVLHDAEGRDRHPADQDQRADRTAGPMQVRQPHAGPGPAGPTGAAAAHVDRQTGGGLTRSA